MSSEMPTRAYRKFPVPERPSLHETAAERLARTKRNVAARREWEALVYARCAACGMVRFHVFHEMDPEHSAEGPEYHAEFAHHAFEERSVTDEPIVTDERISPDLRAALREAVGECCAASGTDEHVDHILDRLQRRGFDIHAALAASAAPSERPAVPDGTREFVAFAVEYLATVMRGGENQPTVRVGRRILAAFDAARPAQPNDAITWTFDAKVGFEDHPTLVSEDSPQAEDGLDR